MENYRILLGPINNGAAIHEEGGTVTLTAAEAAPMVELGIIEPLPVKEVKLRKTAD